MADGFSAPSGGSGVGGAYTATDDAGFDNFFEKARQSLKACAHGIFPLGGSRDAGFVGTGFLPVKDYVDFEVPTAKEAGFTFTAEVDLRVENVATSITPRIVDVTDSPPTVLVTGSAHALTSWGRQSLSFTPVVGHLNRLECIKSNDSWGAWVMGFIQRVAP